MLTIVFLCHIQINLKTYLAVTRKPEVCYNYPYAQRVYVERPYDTNNKFEDGRLSAICGYSQKRCPFVGED